MSTLNCATWWKAALYVVLVNEDAISEGAVGGQGVEGAREGWDGRHVLAQRRTRCGTRAG